MKKKRIRFLIISVLLVSTIAVNLTGCTTKMQSKNLMEEVTPNEGDVLKDIGVENKKVTDFAIRLFQESEESGENTLVSPLSVLCALAMTANGAEGETLEQMEHVFGIKTESLNLYLDSYMKNLPQV